MIDWIFAGMLNVIFDDFRYKLQYPKNIFRVEEIYFSNKPPATQLPGAYVLLFKRFDFI
mgnify:CR=1 FL=1